MNIEYILPLITFWQTITSQIASYKSPEITNNMVSFIHSVSFIIHYNYDYNMNYAVHASLAFFIYDLIYILRRIFVFYRYHRDHLEDPHPHPHPHQNKQTHKDELKKQLPFIIHHIAGIYILYSAIHITNGHFILDGFLMLEKSNIMIYVSYYLHKQYCGYTWINAISEFIQLITYTYYRIFMLSGFIYDRQTTLFTYHYITQLLILLVYSMGYVWSYRLLRINIRNYGMIRAAAASTASRKYSSAG